MRFFSFYFKMDSLIPEPLVDGMFYTPENQLCANVASGELGVHRQDMKDKHVVGAEFLEEINILSIAFVDLHLQSFRLTWK